MSSLQGKKGRKVLFYEMKFTSNEEGLGIICIIISIYFVARNSNRIDI